MSLANLVEALNAGDYTLRAKGAAESLALSDLVQQINRLADNLSTTRFEYKESQQTLDKLLKRLSKIPFFDQRLNRLYTVLHSPNSQGRSRQGIPVLIR